MMILELNRTPMAVRLTKDPTSVTVDAPLQEMRDIQQLHQDWHLALSHCRHNLPSHRRLVIYS